jgi:hypothetical protein
MASAQNYSLMFMARERLLTIAAVLQGAETLHTKAEEAKLWRPRPLTKARMDMAQKLAA